MQNYFRGEGDEEDEEDEGEEGEEGDDVEEVVRGSSRKTAEVSTS